MPLNNETKKFKVSVWGPCHGNCGEAICIKEFVIIEPKGLIDNIALDRRTGFVTDKGKKVVIRNLGILIEEIE